MVISIVNREVVPYNANSPDYFDVTFDSHEIETLLTFTPSIVDNWISQILSVHPSSIVGLDIEWRPNFSSRSDNPVATLQLCVGSRCLIFQIIHAPQIPRSLIDFLQNESFTFVGVGIDKDVEKLNEDYGLKVSNTLDLTDLAVEKMGRIDLKNAGLKTLAKEVIGKEINKPKKVTMSRWDQEWLSLAQVQYACIDAFLSFEIGRHLRS